MTVCRVARLDRCNRMGSSADNRAPFREQDLNQWQMESALAQTLLRSSSSQQHLEDVPTRQTRFEPIHRMCRSLPSQLTVSPPASLSFTTEWAGRKLSNTHRDRTVDRLSNGWRGKFPPVRRSLSSSTSFLSPAAPKSE